MAGSATPITGPRATSPDATLRRSLRAARSRQEWAEVLVHAGQLQQLAPDSPDGWLFAAAALRHLRRRAEMRSLIAEALERFPDQERLRAMAAGPKARPAATSPGATTETLHTNLGEALKRSDWPALMRLAAELREADPADPLGYQLGTRALREQKRIGQAETLSREAIARFPGHARILLERGIVLQKQKRLEEALQCYDHLRGLQPDQPIAIGRCANLLILLGRFDEAESLIAGGLDRFPGEVDLLVHAAIAASRRQDFALARERWDAVQRVAPEDKRLLSFLGSMTLAEQFDSMDDDAAIVPDDTDEAHALDDASVLKRFESLGGNCEFGLVQRAAGIEPLGLLRFAAINCDELIAMLESDLAGVGEAAHTTLSLNVHQEYMLEDTRFFRTHTYINYGGVEEASLLDKLRRRTVFLRAKLLADLRAGSKVFIFRPLQGALDEAEIARLHAAVRRLGPGELVCIGEAPEGAAVSVTACGQGLYVARLPGQIGKLNLDAVQSQRYLPWLALCRMVLAAREAAGPPAETKQPSLGFT